MFGQDIQRLTQILAKLPGLGPRSGRRMALHLLTHKEKNLEPLINALQAAHDNIVTCNTCGNLDTSSPCTLCADQTRNHDTLCIVATVADLWAFERSHAFKGGYHILGGTLSAVDGIGPQQLNIDSLIKRCESSPIKEITFALSGTIDAQTTLHFVMEKLKSFNIATSSLAHGIPLGGELDYLDQGTLQAAYTYRQKIA